MIEPLLIPVKLVAEMLQITEDQVLQRIVDGRLNGHKKDGNWVVEIVGGNSDTNRKRSFFRRKARPIVKWAAAILFVTIGSALLSGIVSLESAWRLPSLESAWRLPGITLFAVFDWVVATVGYFSMLSIGLAFFITVFFIFILNKYRPTGRGPATSHYWARTGSTTKFMDATERDVYQRGGNDWWDKVRDDWMVIWVIGLLTVIAVPHIVEYFFGVSDSMFLAASLLKQTLIGACLASYIYISSMTLLGVRFGPPNETYSSLPYNPELFKLPEIHVGLYIGIFLALVVGFILVTGSSIILLVYGLNGVMLEEALEHNFFFVLGVWGMLAILATSAVGLLSMATWRVLHLRSGA